MPILYMYKNFEDFEKYIFKKNIPLDIDLYARFQEKEKNAKNNSIFFGFVRPYD